MRTAQDILRQAFSKKLHVFAISTLLAVGIALCSIGFAWLSGQLIAAISEAGRPQLYQFAGALLGVAILRGVLQYFRTWISEGIVQHLSQRLRAVLFDRVLHAPPSRRLHPDELAHRIGPDVQRAEAMLHVSLANLPLQLLTGLGVGGYAFYLDWPAASMAASTATILLVAIAMLTKINREAHRVAWDRQADLASMTATTARGSEVLQSFNATDWAIERFEKASDEAFRAMVRAARLRGLTGPVVTIGAVLSAIAVLASVAGRFESGHLTPPEAGSIAVALLLFLRPIQSGAMSAPTISSGLAALDRLSEIMGLVQTSAPATRAAAAASTNLTGDIILLDASVAGDDGQLILEPTSLTVHYGDTLAIVGASGAGKTTLLRALGGQVRLASGTLTISGEPVVDGNMHFSVVPERPVLFRTTLRDNICLGAPAEPQKIAKVLQDVGLTQFVDSLEAGLDTPIARIGDEFSAGERQRICIARALYRETPFLMLDEPTAHLDPTTAEALIGTLHNLLGGRTVVWVTHDERLARIASRVAVVDEGRIQIIGSRLQTQGHPAYLQVFGGRDVAQTTTSQTA